MAPDRGSDADVRGNRALDVVVDNNDNGCDRLEEEVSVGGDESEDDKQQTRERDKARNFLTEQANQGQNFTVRGVLIGSVIGVVICFSNTYFGLQTGWVSGMAMPAALIGFSFFKAFSRYIDYPFTPVENVLVQTVAGAVGTMPLGCGFVGVMPALNYMLKPEENGPVVLGTGKLIIWSLGICFFGVFFAVPLRREVIIRERLKFPSGTATALMIGVLHDNTENAKSTGQESCMETFKRRRSEDVLRPSTDSLRPVRSIGDDERTLLPSPQIMNEGPEESNKGDWKAKIRLLVIAFGLSASYTLVSYFIPQIHRIPIFGLPLATNWLWTLNPSPAYVGQGIIMGPATTLHMLLGAIVGWAILSPMAKSKGYAPGAVSDWEKGSKGWIVWVSLAIMLADSVLNLGWLVIRPVIHHGPQYVGKVRKRIQEGHLFESLGFRTSQKGNYTALSDAETSTQLQPRISNSSHRSSAHSVAILSAPTEDPPNADAPPEHLVSNGVVIIGLILSILICITAVRIVFGNLIPFHAIIIAIIAALLLSVMGVRALGETDLNPVSGISKLTQLFFALIVPASNKNSVIINLLAGAISESGALQAGDMMQDLKTGHLLGAAPKAQFYGQLIGSFVGAIVSAGVYQLYTSVYEVPGDMFQVPTGFVWIFTARLVTGKGLPHMAWQWALGAGIIFAFLTALRIAGQGRRWQAWVPGGIAVAVGMYNVPSFTLARAIGGLVNWYWRCWCGREETPVVVLASGLILGEGVMSIVNLALASLKVVHL